MLLTLILIAFFPLSAAEQNEINPKTKKNCLSDSEFFSSRIDFMA
jgi:hypothetical protein